MTRTIDPVLVKALLDEIGNGFFSVSFVKKDGTERHIRRARLNVTSRIVGQGEASERASAALAAHGNVPVVDLDAEGRGWRCFNLNNVTAIKGAGRTLGE